MSQLEGLPRKYRISRFDPTDFTSLSLAVFCLAAMRYLTTIRFTAVAQIFSPFHLVIVLSVSRPAGSQTIALSLPVERRRTSPPNHL